MTTSAGLLHEFLPASEILRVAEQEKVDLIAMATHGHRFLADVLKGATADRVRHLAKVGFRDTDDGCAAPLEPLHHALRTGVKTG